MCYVDVGIYIGTIYPVFTTIFVFYRSISMKKILPDLDSYYFHLSTQILYDTFADSSLDILSYNETGTLRLDGVRLYQKHKILCTPGLPV